MRPDAGLQIARMRLPSGSASRERSILNSQTGVEFLLLGMGPYIVVVDKHEK